MGVPVNTHGFADGSSLLRQFGDELFHHDVEFLLGTEVLQDELSNAIDVRWALGPDEGLLETRGAPWAGEAALSGAGWALPSKLCST
jgi:hypothetical protein